MKRSFKEGLQRNKRAVEKFEDGITILLPLNLMNQVEGHKYVSRILHLLSHFMLSIKKDGKSNENTQEVLCIHKTT